MHKYYLLQPSISYFKLATIHKLKITRPPKKKKQLCTISYHISHLFENNDVMESAMLVPNSTINTSMAPRRTQKWHPSRHPLTHQSPLLQPPHQSTALHHLWSNHRQSITDHRHSHSSRKLLPPPRSYRLFFLWNSVPERFGIW